MRRAMASIGTACALALACFPAGAAVLYQQVGIETGERGAYSDACQQIADEFVPLASGTLTQVTWQGSYYGTDNPNATESFTLRLFADAGGMPANAHFFEISALASKVAAGTLIGKTLYDYAMTIPGGPTLNSGTTYWIAINTNEPCNNYAWAGSTDGPATGSLVYRSGDLGSWTASSEPLRDNHVFVLNTDTVVVIAPPKQVPVPLFAPGALALLGALLAGAAALRLRSGRVSRTG
jgi:hypothetical protein